MKSKFIFLCLTGIIASGAFGTTYAQGGRIVTPFTPRITDSTGNRVYVQPQEKRHSRIAVTLSYGYAPVTSFNSYANARFPFIFNNKGQNGTVHYDGGQIDHNLGSISLGFNYEITPWLELNIPFVYSHSTGYQRYVVDLGQTIPPIDMSGTLSDDWVTILPSVRINWMRNNWLSLYTRVGVGIGIGNRWVSIDADQSTKCVFGYQVSPVGVEMGKGKFCFYIEGGYGYTGCVTAGIKLKVGKVLKNGKTSTGRQVDWYEKYMH